jgi:hypothetical protein
MDEKDFKEIILKYEALDDSWLLAYRGIARSTDSRTFISCALPWGPASRKLPVLGVGQGDAKFLLAVFNSFVFDFVVRQKLPGTDASFFVVEQLPVPPRASTELQAPWDLRVTVGEWVVDRVLELSYTSQSLDGLAEGWSEISRPFAWDEARRFRLRAELDASMLHVYGLGREDAEHVLDHFRVVREREIAEMGSYRSRDTILDIYDQMTDAIESGSPYETILDPPPAHPTLCHPTTDSRT